MWKTFRFALCLLLFSQTQPQALYAQRGASYAKRIALADTPLQGYPGYFDSYMAEKGGFAFDLPPAMNLVPIPIGTIDYGATERLTVGTNVGTTLLPLLLGGFGLSAKTRALIYGDHRVQSTVTFYGGFMRFSSGEESDESDEGKSDDSADISSAFINVDYEHLTSNTSWYITDRKILTGQLALSRFGLKLNNRGDIDYVSLNMMLIFLGGQYQHFFDETFGFEVSGMYPVHQRLSLDSSGMAVALQADSINFNDAMFALARASANYRFHNWTFNLGLLHMPPFAEVGIWFGAGFKL